MGADASALRLTSFSHGGGCGCKIAPAVLADILKHAGVGGMMPPELLVGIETSDDAAVYQISAELAVVATTDFFMPIVDDPHDFGRIAATNAISDVYAMGARPIFALAIVGMPVDRLPAETIGKILAGGQSVCAAAGIPVAGGHTIDSVEPIYGLVVIGLVHPGQLKRNRDAHVGDQLVLGKGLGVGILSAALKKNLLSEAGYQTMIDATTRLNTPGVALAACPGVHAMTDVTGFGLLGHALEIARGSGATVQLHASQVPYLPGVLDLLAQGCVTGASQRNWSSYSNAIDATDLSDANRALLTDPQTAGGLLVACAPSSTELVLQTFHDHGFAQAAVIGSVHAGASRVQVV